MAQWLFSFTLFLSAFLLFAIQPMVGKILLPAYGGTPAVWTLSMLFFQILLLLAYAYAWCLGRFHHSWHWRLIHLVVIALAFTAYPLDFVAVNTDSRPELSLLFSLFRQLGLPLLILACSAPLLQYAFSLTRFKRAADPYFLYVASNLGSLLALLSYPFFIERYIGLKGQFEDWNLIYMVYLLGLGLVFFAVTYQKKQDDHQETKAEIIDLSRILLWLTYSFIPCSLMMGLTFYLSTDIAPTPLFWVLPLALYLLSFIISFARRPLIPQAWVQGKALIFIFFPIAGFIIGAALLSSLELIAIHLICFFMIALLCHGKLISLRPQPSHLTFFYFCLALGGVLAGLFNGIIAPYIFNGAYEYPLVFALTVFCVKLPNSLRLGFMPLIVLLLLFLDYLLQNQSWGLWIGEMHILPFLALIFAFIWPKNRLTIFISVIILLVYSMSTWFKPAELIVQQRNFYGVKQVLSMFGSRVLLHQNTIHGFQLQGEHTTGKGNFAYYGPVLPVVERLQTKSPMLHAGIIGLGTGMMACQFRAVDELVMIDIDPQVLTIASRPDLFSYLKDCPPKSRLIEGDGRLALIKEPNASMDFLMIDAFSSDAIPMHLLTVEALAIYLNKLKAGGILMANISNRHLDLLPVLTAGGRQFDQLVLHKRQQMNSALGQFASEWVLLTTNESMAFELMNKDGWRFVAGENSLLWSDDYSNLIPLIRW